MNEPKTFGHDELMGLLRARMGDAQGPVPQEVERDPEAGNYAVLFSTALGQAVLLDLCKKTLLNPTWRPGADASHGYFREGQNSIVQHMIDMAFKGEEPTDER